MGNLLRFKESFDECTPFKELEEILKFQKQKLIQWDLNILDYPIEKDVYFNASFSVKNKRDY